MSTLIILEAIMIPMITIMIKWIEDIQEKEEDMITMIEMKEDTQKNLETIITTIEGILLEMMIDTAVITIDIMRGGIQEMVVDIIIGRDLIIMIVGTLVRATKKIIMIRIKIRRRVEEIQDQVITTIVTIEEILLNPELLIMMITALNKRIITIREGIQEILETVITTIMAEENLSNQDILIIMILKILGNLERVTKTTAMKNPKIQGIVIIDIITKVIKGIIQEIQGQATTIMIIQSEKILKRAITQTNIMDIIMKRMILGIRGYLIMGITIRETIQGIQRYLIMDIIMKEIIQGVRESLKAIMRIIQTTTISMMKGSQASQANLEEMILVLDHLHVQEEQAKCQEEEAIIQVT